MRKLLNGTLERHEEEPRRGCLNICYPSVNFTYDHRDCLSSLFGYGCWITWPCDVSVLTSQATTKRSVAIAISVSRHMQTTSTGHILAHLAFLKVAA
jgi:hypothetical protein